MSSLWPDFSLLFLMQLFPQQSDSRLHGCTISKMTLSTGSQITNTYCSSLLVMVQIAVSATPVNKILTPLFPIHKTRNTIFKNHLHLFFQLCCFGKAVSSPDNKAVCSAGGAGGRRPSSHPMPDQKTSFLFCKHYILRTIHVQKVL